MLILGRMNDLPARSIRRVHRINRGWLYNPLVISVRRDVGTARNAQGELEGALLVGRRVSVIAGGCGNTQIRRQEELVVCIRLVKGVCAEGHVRFRRWIGPSGKGSGKQDSESGYCYSHCCV